jgi:hypothetical protein
MSTYDQLLSDKTKIVTANHISNALGTMVKAHETHKDTGQLSCHGIYGEHKHPN